MKNDKDVEDLMIKAIEILVKDRNYPTVEQIVVPKRKPYSNFPKIESKNDC